MALTNAQNQARWRERNIEKRRRAQRIANRLVRKIETVKHVEEIAELLASFFNREGIRTLRRRLKELSESEDMAAHNEAFWKEQGRQRKELWLREHPGRTGKDYKLMGSDEMLEWRKAKGRADIEAEKQAWERDHPGKEYPEHECGLSDREYTDRARWRRQRERRLRGPQHKALPRKRLPDDRPGAAANKEIRRLLDFTFPFIGRFDDRDLRGEFTREDREAIIDALWQSMDELGHLAQRVRDIDLEQTTEMSINDRPSAPR